MVNKLKDWLIASVGIIIFVGVGILMGVILTQNVSIPKTTTITAIVATSVIFWVFGFYMGKQAQTDDFRHRTRAASTTSDEETS